MSFEDYFSVCEQFANHKTEPLQDTFEPWQLSDIVLSVLNVGVKQRGIQVGALVAGKLKSVDQARYLYCGFLKFRNSGFGESKVFHLKGQRCFHVLLQARCGVDFIGKQAASGELCCQGTWFPDAAGLEGQRRPSECYNAEGRFSLVARILEIGRKSFFGYQGLNQREN